MALPGPTLPPPPDPDIETKVRSEFAYTALLDNSDYGPSSSRRPELVQESISGSRAPSRSVTAHRFGQRGPVTPPPPHPEPKTETFVRSEVAHTARAGNAAVPPALARPTPSGPGLDPDPEELTHARDEVVMSARTRLDSASGGVPRPGEDPEEISEARQEVAWRNANLVILETCPRRQTLLGVLADRQTYRSVDAGVPS
jgi:hypothetical protein